MIDIITCRGCGEPYNGAHNMLTLVTAKLDPAKFHVLADVSYPASIGFANQTFNPVGPSEDESVKIGMESIASLTRSTDNKVGLLGYSLGAEVVSKFLEAQAAGEYADCEIAISACMANPLRREGDSIDAQPYGFGINGQMAADPKHPHFECANPADGITSSPADSPLRSLADVVSAFGLSQIGGWGEDLVHRMLERRWQPVTWGWWQHPVKTWDLYEEAAAEIRGYLTGAHTLQYEQGFVDRLARVMNAHA